MTLATTTLFRPVGPRELELSRASGCRELPPRLPEQPIFYARPTRRRGHAYTITLTTMTSTANAYCIVRVNPSG